MQVKWLSKALQNLDDEADYIAHKDIAHKDPAAAKLVLQRIFDSVSLLPNNRAMGNPGRIHGTRELIIPDTRHIIPYRVRPRLNRIEILRVFHTSRRRPKRW